MERFILNCRPISLAILGLCLVSIYKRPVAAQVTSDGTVNTQVDQNGNTAEITGGETRGSNLFHSFQDFSVQTGNEAFFDNANDISNIFSRVTGGNISNIDGAIRANGSSNLFLINPAGIVFGEGARLDIGGSFYGSTASSILFEDGEFSAADLENPPLLTVNAPIGLGFRDEPGDIVNSSISQNSNGEFVGLEVSSENTLALVGGDVNFETGIATARGGNIYLGGLAEAERVSINENDSLSFPDNVILADINLSNLSVVDIASTGGGNATINAQNISLTRGENGSSLILGGITTDSTSEQAQAGDIELNATGAITINGDSVVANQVVSTGVGNAGNIEIDADSLSLSEGASLSSSTFGQGNAGNIEIDVDNAVEINDATIFSNVTAGAQGNGGLININAGSLSLTNGGQIINSVLEAAEELSAGQGNAGNVTIQVEEDVVISGTDEGDRRSAIFNDVESGVEGNAGNIEINAASLTLNNGLLESSTDGTGQAGNVTISVDDAVNLTNSADIFSNVESNAIVAEGRSTISIDSASLSLADEGSSISTSTFGQGNAGNIEIDVDNAVEINDATIFSNVTAGAQGNGGLININAGSLSLINSGQIINSVQGTTEELAGGQGNAGNVTIQVEEDVVISGTDQEGRRSAIFNNVESGGEGNAGNVGINANSLTLNNGLLLSSTSGLGNAGNIGIDVGTASFSNGADLRSNTSGSGDAGNITLNAQNSIELVDSRIDSNVEESARGRGGQVILTSPSISLSEDSIISTVTRPNGEEIDTQIVQAGNIELNISESLSLREESVLISGTTGVGNAGNISITGEGADIIFEDNVLEGNEDVDTSGQFFSSTNNIGNAGNINIIARSLDIKDEGLINSSTFGGTGNAGNITIDIAEDINLNNSQISSNSTLNEDNLPTGNAGAIAINTNSFSLLNEAGVNSDTSGTGNAGNITIDVGTASFSSGADLNSSTSGTGNSGEIRINADGAVTLSDVGTNIFNTVESGGTGNSLGVFIDAQSLNLTNGAQIQTLVRGASDESPAGQGNAGNINIDVETASFSGGADLNSSTLGTGNSGEIRINADGTVALSDAGTNIFNNVESGGIGNSLGVFIDAQSLNLTNGAQIQTLVRGASDEASPGQGNAGNITIDVQDNINLSGSGILNENNFSSQISTGLGGNGQAGNINISSESLSLNDGAIIDASTFGQGNAGAVTVTATGNITADGENSNGVNSGIISQVSTNGVGNAGGVTISTTNLNLTAGGTVDASTLGQGNAGAVNVTATGDITADGEDLDGFPSGITSLVNTGAVGTAGGVTISATNLNLTAGGRVDASTFGQGNANDITLEVAESITINGFIERFRSGISANALNQDGNGGDVSISTGILTITNGGTVEATNFDNIGNDDSAGTGRPGDVTITANSIELTDNARIEAGTQFAEGESGNIDLKVTKDIELREDSFISAEALGDGNGGNLNIDSRFIIAYPDGNNDIFANAQQGNGGNINITAESLLGIREASRNDSTNDIDASSVFSLDGNVTISTPDINPLQGATELPQNVVEIGQTTAQACQVDQETQSKNGLTVAGKGGVPSSPELILDSQSITINGENTAEASAITEPVKTSQGQIQPARGINITDSGEVILTSYRTSNASDRLPEKRSCS